MKLGHIAIAISALLTGAAGWAGTVSGSSNIQFLAFDGQKVKNNTKLTVAAGQVHQVVLEVSGIYRQGADDSFFESAPIVLRFTGSEENVVIKAPSLKSEHDVATFKKQPRLSVETASGTAIAFKQDYLKGEGFLPNANITENLANYNAGNHMASVKDFATMVMPTMVVSNHKASKGKVMVQGENIAEQQLQYWFQQADKETQKRFLSWAAQQ